MIDAVRRPAGWLLAAVLVLVAGTAGRARPAVAADGRCDGVWVVVDARALGGELTTRCAEGDPSSGLAALTAAGHTYSFLPRQPGLVCTIDARPDPCNGAPSDAYWGYYHAPAGGDWTYATRGAGTRDPEPGSVEGWAFGDDVEPGRRPPEPASEPPASEPPASEPTSPSTAAATPSPAPTPTATTAAGSGGSDRSPAPARASATPAPGSATPAGTATPPSGRTAPTPSGDAPAPTRQPGTDRTAEDAPTVAAIEPEGGPDDDGDSPVGMLVGGLLVAGLAGGAVVRSRRQGGEV